MEPPAPLDYESPHTVRQRWFGSAFAVVSLHWVLLFGWGLALNDTARGYLYCRLAMPCNFVLTETPWLFTFAGLAGVLGLGVFDHAVLRISRRLAVFPAVAFACTQMFALWLCMRSTLF